MKKLKETLDKLYKERLEIEGKIQYIVESIKRKKVEEITKQ